MQDIYLNQFKIVTPQHLVRQDDLLKWIIQSHQFAEQISSTGLNLDSIEKLFQRYAVKSTQISQRYLECGDVLNDDFSKNEIYFLNSKNQNAADINQRAHFFSEKAYSVFKKLYDLNSSLKKPDHLIHVTCTGYISPSAAQRVVSEQGWNSSTDLTHAYHMGCYAAMPAVRLAQSLVAAQMFTNNQFFTDIVHTEMCGLHMNPLAHTPEQMVVQTLFADGHIKYTASSNPTSNGKNLKILAMLEKIVPNSQQDMSWIPASWGMQMNLSREVPQKIKLELKQFSNELFQKAQVQVDEALQSVFAIHPGGPKIIDSVQEVLELKNEQILESRKILFEHGNMSSATLPHVWNEILNQNYAIGTKIISYAFGPGLTLFGSVFEVC